MDAPSTVIGTDGQPRCRWCAAAPEFEAYHDSEWGFPVDDDVRLFEKLCLEGFQSGLSWRTILAKRENFRRAFAGFDFHRVARFDGNKVDSLLQDAGIVRHRGKIEAVIHNAGRAVDLQAECGSLARFFWRFEADPLRAAAVGVDLARIHGLVQRPEAARLEVRGSDDGLCLHAGHGAGERPCARLCGGHKRGAGAEPLPGAPVRPQRH